MLNRIIFTALLGSFLLFTACDNIVDSNNPSDSELNLRSQASSQMKANVSPVKGSDTILEIAAGTDDFSILAEVVLFAGLDEVLDGRRQLTVFAPTNQAFIDLLDALGITAEELLVEENKGLVTEILLYHVAPGKRFAKSVLASGRVNTLLEEFAYVKTENGNALIGNDTYGFATILATDVFASNGVVHVIDSVLLPPSLEL